MPGHKSVAVKQYKKKKGVDAPASIRKDKIKHRRFKARTATDGSVELQCPSCEGWVMMQKWFDHDCPNPIVQRD